MPYTHVCAECGLKSDAGKEYCPGCGARKGINIDKSDASEMIYNAIDSEVGFIDKPSFYVKIIVSLSVLFGGIFLLPDFLAESETFWMLYIGSNIFTVIKTADKLIPRLHGLYYASSMLLFIYAGSGLGNLISHAGKNAHIPFGYFFNPGFLNNQLFSGNPVIIIGGAAGLLFFFLVRFLGGVLRS